LTDALAEVEALRQRAVHVVHDATIATKDKCLAVIDIAARGRSSAWAWAAVRAVWPTIRGFLETLGCVGYVIEAECTRCGRPCETCYRMPYRDEEVEP
jgi:hypothetical protein